MSKLLSFSDLKSLYSNRGKHAQSLTISSTRLPSGATTLQTLYKLYSERQKCLLPTQSAPISSKKIIAICLVIVDTLFHEDVWKLWEEVGNASEGSPFRGRVFIHAKYPQKISSVWVRERTLPFSFAPEWNSVEVIQAMLATMELALEYTKTYATDQCKCECFIFGTESCIPIRSVDECGQIIFQHSSAGILKSWLDVYNTPDSTWERGSCFLPIDANIIPKESIWKSLPGWIMLSRRHGEEILALINRFGDWKQNALSKDDSEHNKNVSRQIVHPIIRAFGTGGTFDNAERGVFAPEEMFFATMLAILGYLRSDKSTDEVYRRNAVFAEWKRRGEANPIAFPHFTAQLHRKFQDSGSLLARKFPLHSVDLSTWNALVLGNPIGGKRSNTQTVDDYNRTDLDIDHDEVLSKRPRKD